MSHEHTIILSLSPKISRGNPESAEGGQAHQRRCVQSWLDAGARVVSVNNPTEIAILEEIYHSVLFVATEPSDAVTNPRGLPTISEMLRVGIDCENCSSFAIANSDVEFRADRATLKSIFDESRDGAVFSNRYERGALSTDVGLPYLYGYDFIAVDKKYVVPAETEGFLIGSPWWDYVFLYMLAARDVKLSVIGSPVLAHLTHTQAWSHQAWFVGLQRVATRIRRMAKEEGPAAALLGYLCRHLEQGMLPGYGVNQIVNGLGIAIGTSIVAYVGERCQNVLWFETADVGGGYGVRGVAQLASMENHFDFLDGF